MARSILKNLGVYGWSEIEDFLFAGYVGEFGVLLVGHSGSAKTLALERIGEALERAYKAEGRSFQHRYRNASTARVEDIIGYPIPLSADEAAELRKQGKEPKMQVMLAKDSVKYADQLVIDEINRCQALTQNKWFSLIAERRVDGHDLENLKYVFGMMNPPNEYEGTEILDRAFADRFNLLVQPVTFDEMRRNSSQYEDEMNEIIGTRLKREVHSHFGNQSVSYGEKIAQTDCEEVKSFIEEGQRALPKVVGDYYEPACDYVRLVVNQINESIGGGPNTQAKITGRRAAMIAQSALSLHAVGEVKGVGTLKDDAEAVLLNSLMHEVTGDEPVSEQVLRSAHDNFRDRLESRQSRILAELSSMNNRARRVVTALNKRVGPEIASKQVNDAHNYYAERDEAKRLAFSFTLFNRLQDAEQDVHKQLSKHVMEELAVDVKRVLEDARDFSIEDVNPHPALSSSESMAELTGIISELQGTARGRAALALSASIFQIAQSGPQRSGAMANLDDDSLLTKKYSDMANAIRSGVRLVEDFTEEFEDLQI